MKQSNLCVLALANKGDWCRAYELERVGVAFSTGIEVIGSEADTRLYEIFDKRTPDEGEKSLVINGDTFTVETKRIGGERWWRAYLTSKKPVRKMVQVVLPDGTRAVREVLEAPAMPLNASVSPELEVNGVWEELSPWDGSGLGIYHEIYATS
jgi:hypothetical protein